MCIVSVTRNNQRIPDVHSLRRMWHRNPDGAGFVIASDGHPVTPSVARKGFMTFDHFLDEFEKALSPFDLKPGDVAAPRYLKRIVIATHFRIGTHGANVPQNTHPWEVCPGRVWLMHNGIIHGLNPATIPGADEFASDSQWYGALLKPLITPALSKFKPGASIFEYKDEKGNRRLTNFARSLRDHVEPFIGRYNKIILMDSNGGSLICNAEAGVVDGAHLGTWFSNSGYVTHAQASVCDPRHNAYRTPGSLIVTHEDKKPVKRPKVYLPGGTFPAATTTEALQHNLFTTDEPFTPRLKSIDAFKRASAADAAIAVAQAITHTNNKEN